MDRENISAKIAWNMTRVVVPFYFSTNLPEERLDVWAYQDLPLPRFFPYIQTLVGPKGQKEAICQRYVLTGEGRNALGISSPDAAMCMTVADQELCQIKIVDIELYLFETKVGFLVYDIRYEDNTGLDAIIEGNYYFKRQAYENYELTNAEYCEAAGTSFAKMTGCLLTQLNTAKTEKQFKPYQSLIFTVAVLDKAFATEPERDHRLKEYLFRLRRAFKESYKPAAAEYSIDNNPEVFQSFQNSYWGLSLEGLSNIAYLVEDESTDHFFLRIYPELVRTSYFFIYLMALHQRYALMQLNIEATDIDKTLESGTNKNLMASLTEKIGFFSLRCYYSQISDNTHYARLYSRTLQVLAVEPLMRELHFELDVLSSLARLKEAQAIEWQEKRENKFKNHILLLSTLFVGISTTSDLWAIFLNLSEGRYPDNSLALFGGLVGLIWSAIIVGIAVYYYRFGSKK